MDKLEAREVLMRCRPGTRDDRDREVRLALDWVARDPELAEWWEAHQRYQEAVRTKLGSVEVPAGLREQILSEAPMRIRAWSVPRRLALGALAALLLLVGLGYYFTRDAASEDRFANFRLRMVKTVLRGYAMDLETRDPGEIRAYLASRQVTAGWEAPPVLDEWPLIGCAVLRWRNQPATLLCYSRGTDPELWLFMVDANTIRDGPRGSHRVFAVVNQLSTVSWTQDGRTYLLAARMSDDALRRLLGTGA